MLLRGMDLIETVSPVMRRSNGKGTSRGISHELRQVAHELRQEGRPNLRLSHRGRSTKLALPFLRTKTAGERYEKSRNNGE